MALYWESLFFQTPFSNKFKFLKNRLKYGASNTIPAFLTLNLFVPSVSFWISGINSGLDSMIWLFNDSVADIEIDFSSNVNKLLISSLDFVTGRFAGTNSVIKYFINLSWFDLLPNSLKYNVAFSRIKRFFEVSGIIKALRSIPISLTYCLASCDHSVNLFLASAKFGNKEITLSCTPGKN